MPNVKSRHFETYRDDLRSRLIDELSTLKQKAQDLRLSSNVNRDILLATYDKLISRKEQFLLYYRLDPSLRPFRPSDSTHRVDTKN